MALAGCTEATAPTGHSSPALPTGVRAAIRIVRDSVADVIVNGCPNGEPVIVSGTQQLMVEVTRPSNDGSYHFRATIRQRLTGVGTLTSATYNAEISSVVEYISNSGAATVFEMSGSGRLIGRGNVPNGTLEYKTRIIADANGGEHTGDTFNLRCQ